MATENFLADRGVMGLTGFDNAKDAVAALAEIEADQRRMMVDYAKKPIRGIGAAALGKIGRYPIIVLKIDDTGSDLHFNDSFGFVRCGPGIYASTVAGLGLLRMRAYWTILITLLMKNYHCKAFVGVSPVEIPFNLLAHDFRLKTEPEMDRLFPPFIIQTMGSMTSLRKNEPEPFLAGCYPIALSSAMQVDFGRCKLEYYTGIKADDFQDYIVVTNYKDLFVSHFQRLARDAVKKGKGYTAFVQPPRGSNPQMPAYSLKRADGSGITLVRAGIGASNAATFMESLQVIRPRAVIMNGHCAGLHPNQRIGQFLLADGYFRRDRLFDQILPLDMAIVPVGEINYTLKLALERVGRMSKQRRRDQVQTGIVATTLRRYWETEERERQEVINARAVGLDMESATVATVASLARLPFGTFLCVSDLPLHGAVKLTATTQKFYENTADRQLKIVIRAMEMLRLDPFRIQSRKCRASDDPPAL